MSNVYEGMLKNNNISYCVRRLALTNMIEILSLQKSAIKVLTDAKTLQPLSREDYEWTLNGNGLILGVFVENQLIALRALMVPKIDEDHLGRDIGLSEEKLEKVIYQEISIVHPDFRGNKLQMTLASLIMKELHKEKHAFQYVCCTVAPFNIPSLKDKLSQGMEIAALKEKYGGNLRYIFVKDLKREKETPWLQVMPINMGDIQKQKEWLAQGWRGFQMEKRQDQYWIHYGLNE